MTVVEVDATFVTARPGFTAAVAEVATIAAEIELTIVSEIESLESELSEEFSLDENHI